jgi:hypothetical protein
MKHNWFSKGLIIRISIEHARGTRRAGSRDGGGGGRGGDRRDSKAPWLEK